jgi:hypothetical protein
MLIAGDGEAIRAAALRALREDLTEAARQAYYSGDTDKIESIKRQIDYVEKMVFLELSMDGLLPVTRDG